MDTHTTLDAEPQSHSEPDADESDEALDAIVSQHSRYNDMLREDSIPHFIVSDNDTRTSRDDDWCSA